MEPCLRVATGSSSNGEEIVKMIIKDKKLKRKLDRIPDVDKNGDPIYKIDDIKKPAPKEKGTKSK